MYSTKPRCVAVNCPSTAPQLHRFPKDYGRCHIWAERAGCLHLLEKGVEAMNTNYRLCSDHFHDRCYSSTERKRLTYFAVPEIFNHHPDDVTEPSQQTVNAENSGVSQRCRTCANVYEDLIPIFGDRGVELQLPTKIHTHLPIMVSAEDLLPLALCSSCIDRLEMCNEFVHCCLQADSILRALLTVGFKDVTNEATPVHGQAANEVNVGQNYDQVDDIPSLEDCFDELTSDENGVLMERDKFKVIVMKMKANNESSDTQLERALNVLKTIENVPSDTGNNQGDGHNQILNPLEDQGLLGDSSVEVPDYLTKSLMNQSESDSLPVLSCEDTAVIDKHLPDIFEDTISTLFLENNDGVKHNNSSNMPLDVHSTVLYCGHCEKSIIGKENLLLHEKTEHADKLCCPDCNVVIDKSNEHFCKHRETHLNDDSSIGNPHFCSNLIDVNRDLTSEYTEPAPNNSNCKVYGESDQMPKQNFRPVETEENEPKIISVANICVESQNVPGEERLENSSKVRMKISKEFDNIESTLQSKIIEAVKGMIQMSKTSDSKMENTSKTVNSKKESCNSKQWNCEKCNHICASWGEYVQHLQSHRPQSLQCSQCNKEFKTKAKLKLHLSSHTQEKAFMCEYCGKGFSIKQKLKIHLLTHGEGEMMFECKKCGKKFGTKTSYETHFSSHAEASYLCDICGKSMKYIGSLRVHRSSHVNPKFQRKFNCVICGKDFQNKTLLNEHMRTHSMTTHSNDRPFKCPHCVKTFQKKSQITEHLAVHTNVRQHKCPECGKGFNRLGSMKIHAQKHHSPNEYICLICNVTFSALKDLRIHKKMHDDKREQGKQKREPHISVYICNICGKKLATKLTLKYHILLHSGNRPFTCDTCGKSYAIKRKLQLHCRIHNTTKPFICLYCNKEFYSKQYQIIHQRLHTGEKPFKCTKCDKAFRSLRSLTQHLPVHSDARPYECEQCGKSFRRRDTLETHMRTHTGERPYRCEVCCRGFKQKGDCNKHVKTHFSQRKARVLNPLTIIDFTCIHCGQDFSEKHELDSHFEAAHTANVMIASDPMMVINDETVVSLPPLGSCLETM